jgi:hypothetical protein
MARASLGGAAGAPPLSQTRPPALPLPRRTPGRGGRLATPGRRAGRRQAEMRAAGTGRRGREEKERKKEKWWDPRLEGDLEDL